MATDAAQPRVSAGHELSGALGDHGRRLAARCAARARADWRGDRMLAAGLATALLACLLAALFHLNRPAPFAPYHDSYEYAAAADRILAGGWWVDAQRMPGYPLLLAGTFLLFGRDNVAAANLVENLLFVLTAVAVYALAYRLWRRTRVALAVGALFATNFYFLSFVKPILSDGLAVLLTVLLALAALGVVERPSARRFWLMAGCLLALVLTRAEWYLFPIPLFVLTLWAACGRGPVRRLLPHAAAATVLIYVALGGYALMNARINGYTGLTDAQEINLYGKVMQYHMQNEASPRFADLAHLTDWYVARGHTDPWYVYRRQPWMGEDHFRQIGAYARDIVVHHPLEFLRHTIAAGYRSLYPHAPFAIVNPSGRMASVMSLLQQVSELVFPLFLLFPFCALGWAALLALRWRGPRGREWRLALGVCVVSAIALYDLAVTTAGSYGEYTRLHLAFDPLMLAVVVGTLVALVAGRRGQQDAARGARGTTT